MKKIFGIGWYDIPMILLVMSYTLLFCSVIYWVLYCIVSYRILSHDTMHYWTYQYFDISFPSIPFCSISFHSGLLPFPFLFLFLSDSSRYNSTYSILQFIQKQWEKISVVPVRVDLFWEVPEARLKRRRGRGRADLWAALRTISLLSDRNTWREKREAERKISE